MHTTVASDNANGSAAVLQKKTARTSHARVLYERCHKRAGQKDVVCLLASVSDRDDRTNTTTNTNAYYTHVAAPLGRLQAVLLAVLLAVLAVHT